MKIRLAIVPDGTVVTYDVVLPLGGIESDATYVHTVTGTVNGRGGMARLGNEYRRVTGCACGKDHIASRHNDVTVVQS